jgi:branched-chain amino acid transport system permease protein
MLVWALSGRRRPAHHNPPVAVLLQVLVAGLAGGGVVGVAAIGVSLVYRLTGVVNLAFGGLIGFGVFVTLLVATGTDGMTTGVGRGRIALAVAVAVLLTAGVAVLLYAVGVEPHLARTDVLGWVAATAAIAVILQALVTMVFRRPAYVVPDPLGVDGLWHVGGTTIAVRSIVVALLAVVLAGLASLLLERTRTGRGLQAVTDDRDAAELVGIPAARSIALAFAVAGALAVVVAVVAAPGAPFAPDTGTLIGARAIAAAAVVGFASPWRSFAGGVVFGLTEAAVANLSVPGLEPARASTAIPFGAALLVVLLRARRGAWEAT